MPDEIRDAIESNATGPKSVSVDGQSVTQHSIDDQIKADKHLAGATGVTRANLGIRFRKTVPPGSV